MLTMAEALATNARRYRHKVALVQGERRLTYGAFEERVRRAARLLHDLGVRPGEHVALLLPNGLEMAELYFACATLGAVAVPINLRLAPPEMAYVLTHSDSVLLVADAGLMAEAGAAGVTRPPGLRAVLGVGAALAGLPEYGQLLERTPPEPPEVRVDDEDPFVLVYTSGTTGRPKGALRSHRSNLMIALLLASELGIGPDDTGLAVLPMFHVNGLWLVSLSLAIGTTLALYPHRMIHPATVVEELARHGATYSMFVPTLLTYLADAAEAGAVDPQTLRVILSSSSPLPPALRDRILRAFPRARLYDIYGATELGAVTLMRHEEGGVAGSVGFPALAQDVRLLGPDGKEVPPGVVGELHCSGPTLMTRYYKDDAATRQAFAGPYLSVGDLAYRDEAGRIFLVDRKSDMIITSGENVYPQEVENALQSHPAVALAAVVGLPDARRGEEVVAVVTLREGHDASVPEIQAHLAASLADYKRPRRLLVWPELPIGATGKVLRREVKRRLLEGSEAAPPAP